MSSYRTEWDRDDKAERSDVLKRLTEALRQLSELREGIARMEHMAQQAQAAGDHSIYVSQVIDEARRLRNGVSPNPLARDACRNCERQTQRATDGACLVCGLNPAITCLDNAHGERHCWHWLNGPPRADGPVWWAIARCCWCGYERRFTVEDTLTGRAPVSVKPSGAFHGALHARPVRQ